MLSAFTGVNAADTPDEIYENRGTVLNVNVDAKRFLNSGLFQISDSVSRQPYSTLNTSHFTNTQSGRISVSAGLGVRFQLITNNLRQSAETFVNFGQIESAGGGRIEIEAKKLVSPGRMISTTAGRILLKGQDVDLERGAFSALRQSATSGGTSFSFIDPRPTNYFNVEGVEDVYWGAGLGGRFVGSPPFTISFQTAPFPPPPGPASTPLHEVTWPALLSIGYINFFSQSSYGSYVYKSTNFGTITNIYTQIVLVNTNSQATNIGVDVRFLQDVGSTVPLVRFTLDSTNVTTSSIDTNVLYFVDTSSLQTNAGVATNILNPTLRPRSFDIETGGGLDFSYQLASIPNGILEFDTFLPGPVGSFTNSSTTNYRYWAYGAKIGSPESNSIPVTGTGGNLSLSDATNKPGRVEIIADQLNLKSARVQAENTIQITTTNLLNSEGAVFSAPNLVFDVAKTSGTLTLTNFVPAGVTNFHGFLRAYSTVWTNIQVATGHRYTFHVLMLDASLLDGQTAVQLPTMKIKAPNIVVQNRLNAARSLVLDSAGLTFKRGTEFKLDSVTIPDLLRTNFPSLLNLTNEGIISVPQLADIVGAGTGGRLANFINKGVVVANTLNIRSTNFESAGTNGAFAGSVGFVPTTFALLSLFSGGTMDIYADSSRFELNPAAGARGRNLAVGDITIAGNSLKMINQDFITPARLNLNISNLISDGGIVGSNLITVGRGFSVLRKPDLGDLLGTSIESVIPHDLTITHQWPGTDRGKFVSGYSNNVALGRLTLNTTNLLGQPYLVQFSGTGTSNAMYVDLLDLRGSITNENLSRHLQIDSNLKIYFANASPSVDYLLTAITNDTDSTLRDRLIWVPDFAGPNSSQLVSYVDSSGQVVQTTVNSAKFNSRFLDSDGDGVVNSAEDRLNSGTPFDGVLVRNAVGYTVGGGVTNATITWRAAKETDYRVEISSNLQSGWSYLTNRFNTNVVNGDVSFTDSVPAGTAIRFYRIGYRP